LGLGPSGELRFPAHAYSAWATANLGDECPGVGAFYTFSNRAIEAWNSYKNAKGNTSALNPDLEISYEPLEGPNDFQQGLTSEHGTYLMAWYGETLITHAKKMIEIGKAVIAGAGGTQRVGIIVSYSHKSTVA
jgi:hypothetical protein